MKSHVLNHVALAALAPLVAFGALLAGLTGCGEDDFDRQAAFPEPIGYTAPPSKPTQAQAAGQGAAPTSPPPPPPAQIPPPPAAAADDEVADGQQPVQPAPGEDYADTDPSALTDFHGALDPYGSWVDDPTYGTIWVPSSSVVGDDFSPYQTAGHWTYDDEYTWVSDYDWGWAPFHYGRWAYAAPYGWGWIPGRVYAGAWVNWRYGYGDWGYVGWAPMGPTWGWRGGMAVGLGFVPAEPYGFCATGNLFDQHVVEHMVSPGQAGTVGAHTRPYVAARPTVNGGSNGQVVAHPTVNGPSPQVLGIPPSSVAHGALANRGVVQARAYSHASTASTLGAHEPQSFGARNASPSAGGLAYGRSEPSHFGGKLGSGFSGSVYNMPHAYGSSYGSSYGRGYGGGSGYSGPSYRGGAYGLYGGYGSHAGPTFRGGYGGYGGYGGSSMFGQPGVPAKGSGKSRSTSTSSGWGGYSGGGHGGGGSHGGGGHGGGHR